MWAVQHQVPTHNNTTVQVEDDIRVGHVMKFVRHKLKHVTGGEEACDVS